MSKNSTEAGDGPLDDDQLRKKVDEYFAKSELTEDGHLAYKPACEYLKQSCLETFGEEMDAAGIDLMFQDLHEGRLHMWITKD